MRPLEAVSLGSRRRLPVILQTEAAECALACLAMVAHYHGCRIELAALRRRFPISLKGTTLAALVDIARRLELETRAVRLELDDLGRLRRPCILHWRFNHFVVLKRVGPRRATIHDPATGARTLPLRELSEAFTGVALELWPGQSFAPRRARRTVRLRELIGRVTGLRRTFAQVVVLALALEVFAVASPLLLQWVVDHVLVAGDAELLTVLAIGFALLVLLQQTVTALRATALLSAGAAMNVQWQANAFSHLLALPLAYFEKRHLGDIVSRFRSIDAIQRTLTTAFAEALIDGLMTFVLLGVIWLYSPGLTAICAAAVALYALGRWLSYRPLRAATEEQIVHAAKQESHFIETVRGIRAIKLFRRRDERRSSWLALLVEQLNAGVRTQRLQIGCRVLNGVLFGLENVAVIYLGARAVLDSRLSAGMLLAFLAYKGQLAARVTALIDKTCELAMLRLQGERLADVLLVEREHERGERLLLADAARPAASLEVRGLRYRYAEHEPDVLTGVDLYVAPGECVAITGPSGCGKSTLVGVVLGILWATEGEVLLDGVPLEHLGPDAARCAIAAVTQNDTLFAGSIAENISLFDPAHDQRRVEECAALAAVHDEIAAMPMGYNTFVGYLGAALSGGQQQRILLARALYKRPRLLVLDEATSHLDVERERRVAAAVRALNVTRLIVAHRPQTVATADRLLTMAAGRIVRESAIERAARTHRVLGEASAR